MSKIPSPFKRVLPPDDSQFIATPDICFEASFDLPNDGTPSPNQLIMQVIMENEASTVCTVRMIGRTFKDTILGEFNTNITNLGNVLYGFARIKTIPVLTFNSDSDKA